MKIFNTIVVAGVVALVVSLGAYTYFAPVKQAVDSTFGSASSPSVNGNCMDVNGVTRCSQRIAVRAATTTPCALKSPSATSTLASASVLLRTSSSTATTWTLAKSANPFATTTSLGDHVVAGSAQAAILATTTATVGLNDKTVFGPNTYLVVSEVGGITAGDAAGTGFVPAGSCNATFEIL